MGNNTYIEQFVMVRKDESHEYLDLSTLSGLQSECTRKANEMDEAIPHWANSNKRVRMAMVSIRELGA